MNAIEDFWKPIDWEDEETFPPVDEIVLVSFSNFDMPLLGKLRGSSEDGYSMYSGENKNFVRDHCLFAKAWMPMPKCYRDEI